MSMGSKSWWCKKTYACIKHQRRRVAPCQVVAARFEPQQNIRQQSTVLHQRRRRKQRARLAAYEVGLARRCTRETGNVASRCIAGAAYLCQSGLQTWRASTCAKEKHSRQPGILGRYLHYLHHSMRFRLSSLFPSHAACRTLK